MKLTTWPVCLMLAWLVFAPGLAASSVSHVHLAEVEAAIGIGIDGAVTSVELRRTPAVQGEVGDRLEERMRNWRFVVVRDEHGAAVPARALVSMVLEARQHESGRIEVRMSQPSFNALLNGKRVSAADVTVDGKRIHRVSPKWPRRAAHASSRMLVLAEVDASGRVVRAGARRVQLLGVQVGANEHGRAREMLLPFVKSAERAVSQWRFPPAEDGQTQLRTVLIPMGFHPTAHHKLLDWELAVSIHALEQDWAQPSQRTSDSDLQMVPDDDLSYGLVRLVDSLDGQLL